MKKNRNIEKKWRTIQSQLRQRKRYCVKFNDSLRNLGQVKVLLYVLCVEATSMLHMEDKMISKDTRTPQIVREMWILFNDKKLIDFGASSATANLDQKVVKAKLLFSAFLVEHKLPLTSADHLAKIFRNMFPDFEIMNKYRYGRTKTTHMLAGAVSKQITRDLKEGLLLTPWYGLATDESRDEDDKLLPVSV